MASKRSRQAFEADWQKQEAPFVLYGTPLPPLDDRVRDDGSFVPVWKQEVRDDRGRKRLHGAFTGGFSAGYFNTVGSKEGWTPSSFVSSRQQRAKDGREQRQQQRPEDFMDEEDLREAEESKQLSTADGFSGFGTEHDERHRATLKDVFRPAGETAGMRLLRRMGWKEGQGIGPKIKRKADLDDDSELSADDDLHTFAPDDVSMLSFAQKNDRKGLGFEGESMVSSLPRTRRQPVLDESDDEEVGPKHGGIGTPKLPKRRGGGIGVGILNDTGSDDDDDPYSMGPKISYNKTIGGDKKAKKKPSTSVSMANPALKTKPMLLSKKLASLQGALRKCHDGRLPLDGFVLGGGGGDNDNADDSLDGIASLSLKSDKYKPPAVPADWKSSLSTNQAAVEKPSPNYTSVSEAAKSSKLDAKSRASVLGEASLPGKSVFDFLSPAARDRLAAASGKSDLPPGLGEKPRASSETGITDIGQPLMLPHLSPSTALDALSRATTNDGWMPYSDDPAKQQRYKTFLETMAFGGTTTTSTSTPTPGINSPPHDEEWMMEQQEFARAAEVFRPVRGAMASRFTSSTSTQAQSQSANNSSNNNSSSSNGGADSLLLGDGGRPGDKVDPAAEAARMGMFGHLTRSYVSFHPTRLLCKRFGVPVPDPVAEEPVSGVSTTTKTTARGFQSARYEDSTQSTTVGAKIDAHVNMAAAAAAATATAAAPVPATTSSTEMDPERNEALEQDRPGQAVFRAVFGE